FSFFLHKSGRERVLCILSIDALKNAAQSNDLSEPVLNRILDAHRQLIELRAAQKVNAGLVDPNGSVLLGADDMRLWGAPRSSIAPKGKDGRWGRNAARA